MAMGLGMMSGTSPFAGVNIGRGGLQGLQFAEQQRMREEQASLRRLQAEDLAEYRHDVAGLRGQQIGINQQRANTGQERADIYGQHMQDMGAYQRGLLEARQRGMSDKEYNDQWMRSWRQGNQDLSLANSITRSGQADQRIQLQQAAGQRQEEGLSLRRQALAQAKDTAEQRAIQLATNSDLARAASVVNGNPGMKFSDALAQVRQGRASITPQPTEQTAQPQAAPGGDPLAQARAAIAAGAPRDAVIQRLQAHGIDPSGL
jgi:hypothetical protein